MSSTLAMNDAQGIFDDGATIVAMAVLACILQNVLHEGVGHAVAAWFTGAHQITLSTVAMQSDVDTRWISASGTIINLIAGAAIWLILRWREYSTSARYFLVLAMAGNLFTGTGYFFFSGVTNFGDWASVIHGSHPHWLWRAALVVVGVASYYSSMMLVGSELRYFKNDATPRRMRRLCWVPYMVDGVLALVAGVLNPAGLFYVIASALPSTLGANAGLLSLPSIMRRWAPREPQSEGIPRGVMWIGSAVVAALIFILVIGRGVTWSRG